MRAEFAPLQLPLDQAELTRPREARAHRRCEAGHVECGAIFDAPRCVACEVIQWRISQHLELRTECHQCRSAGEIRARIFGEAAC